MKESITTGASRKAPGATSAVIRRVFWGEEDSDDSYEGRIVHSAAKRPKRTPRKAPSLSVDSGNEGEEQVRVLSTAGPHGEKGQGAALSERRTFVLFSDPKADFEIISEDGVSLRIPSYHLLANSSFFRDLQDRDAMLSPYSLSASAATIEDLLSLMTQRNICSVFDQQYVPRFRRLARLTTRLQCSFLLDRISLSLIEAIDKPEHQPWYIFWAAVAIDDRTTCQRAIPSTAALVWSETPPGLSTLLHGVPGCSKLDITAMPRQSLHRLPVDYMVALGRAYRLRGRYNVGGSGDWAAVAEEFARLIKEAPPIQS